jgi:hypothetical protein
MMVGNLGLENFPRILSAIVDSHGSRSTSG